MTGGICNNSGGSLIRRGPAVTQLSIHVRITAEGELKLVNHLGIGLGDSAEAILGRLDTGELPGDIPAATGRLASDHEYSKHVHDLAASTSARFNADPRRLIEYRNRFEHHLLLKMGNDGVQEARTYLQTRFPTQMGDYFECTPEEGTAAFLNRFAIGGAMVR